MADSKPEQSGSQALRPQDSWRLRDEANAPGKGPAGEGEHKDPIGGTDSIIPLSPQWLFSKPGDSKPSGATSSELSRSSSIESSTKDRWRDSVRGNERWRPNSIDRDSGETGREGGRRLGGDRWGEDERETVPLGKTRGTDRWMKDSDREPDVPRKTGGDRWQEVSRPVEGGEYRSRPERWSETNRDPLGRGNEQKRESKWTVNRWGASDEKEKDTGIRSKWVDSDREKESETLKEKAPKETDKDVEVRDRPGVWRPQGRGRGEAPPGAPAKFVPSAGRGRGDTHSVGFSIGRGRGNSGAQGPIIGASASPERSDRWDTGSSRPSSRLGEPTSSAVGASNIFQYSKGKLLEVFHKCSTSPGFMKYPEGFVDVPQLTQEEPLEPLALISPSTEEEVRIELVELKQDFLFWCSNDMFTRHWKENEVLMMPSES